LSQARKEGRECEKSVRIATKTAGLCTKKTQNGSFQGSKTGHNQHEEALMGVLRDRFKAVFRNDDRSWLTPSSIAFHAALIVLFVHTRPAFIAPVRLPGTMQGSHIVLTYAPGRSPAQQNMTVKNPHVAKAKAIVIKKKQIAADQQTASLNTPTPPVKDSDATPGNDALGTGDVNIALLANFPTPKPDLSQLPHGTKGDVILDIVIDETGKIVQMTIARGLGHGVDESVIATVHQWTFHPATRNGKPVASEQELLFHYEKS
jgi:protein TonB